MTGFAGAWNQRSPVPLRRMPKLTPLRAITVTRLLPGTPCAASDIDLHAAIERLRKKWSLPATNASARTTAPPSSLEPSSASVNRLNSSAGGAALRLCSSSPMCSACAISGLRSASASPRTATCIAAKNSVPSQRSRSSTSGEFAPKRSTLPRPSLTLQIGAVAAIGVLDHPDRHRRADDAGHRPDGAVLVARFERDGAGPRPASRRPRASRPSPRTGSRR